MMKFRQIFFRTIVVLACLAIVYVIGWVVFTFRIQTKLDRIVAVSWGDEGGGDLKAFYGAYVFLVPEGGEYSVRATIHIGRGNGYYHDCGEIGRAKNDVEAVEKWGTITWKEDGLYIGNPSSGGYHLPRSKLESGR